MELSTDAGELGLWARGLERNDLWINSRLRSLFGFDGKDTFRIEEMIARIHPDDQPRVVVEVERAQRTGEPFEDEFRVLLPDGGERWVATKGRTVAQSDGNGRRRMGVMFDITQRKRTEQDLNTALVEIQSLKERLEEENIYLKEEISEVKGFDEIIGKSDALKYVLKRVEQVAKADSTVLLQGETGVGKELIARAIHEKSSRCDGPHVKVNCAALPEALVESELFGHEKGAFTGADRQRKGRFELADGGTILLDEVGELPMGTQVKLLRVLQEGEFERVGGSNTIKVSVRVIAATNRKLYDEVSARRFRQDLFYRLNVYPITIPPLRQRREDIPLLVSHYARQTGERLSKTINEIPGQVMREFTEYNWPGNVRELQNVIERAVITSSDGVLRLPEPLGQATPGPAAENKILSESTTISTLDDAERDHILRALEATGWRINGLKGAAAMLKIHPSTLRFRMKKLGLTKLSVYPSQSQKSSLH
jgi:PAS domain S-box-containing protein